MLANLVTESSDLWQMKRQGTNASIRKRKDALPKRICECICARPEKCSNIIHMTVFSSCHPYGSIFEFVCFGFLTFYRIAHGFSKGSFQHGKTNI